MTEGSLIAPVAPRLAAARETVAAALVLSVAAHAGPDPLGGFRHADTRNRLARRQPGHDGSGAGPGTRRAARRRPKPRADELTARTPDRAVSHDAQPPAESAAPEKIRGPAGSEGRTASEAADTSFIAGARGRFLLRRIKRPRRTAAAAADAAPPPARSPAPHPPAKPTPPPLATALSAAAPGPIAALALHDKTSASAVAAGPLAGTQALRGSGRCMRTDRTACRAPRRAPTTPRPITPTWPACAASIGRVVLDVEVLASGEAGVVRVEESSGYDILDQAALESVKRWRFVPARRNGEPVPASVRIPDPICLAVKVGVSGDRPSSAPV